MWWVIACGVARCLARFAMMISACIAGLNFATNRGLAYLLIAVAVGLAVLLTFTEQPRK